MSKTTTDHDEIRAWAEKHGGVPAAVDRTHEDGGDVGIIRIMFPKAKQSEHGSLVEISWDEFFEQFEESGLALIIDDNSNFNKFVGRETADKRAHGEHDAARHKERGFAGDHRSSPGGSSHSGKDAGSHAMSSQGKTSQGKSSEAKTSESKSSQGKSGKGEGGDDLKSREYRDAEGNVHHHTRPYMESHGKEKR